MHEVAGLWYLLVAGAVFAIALGYVSGLALARMASLDRTTGIFASVPGGAAEMSILGERFGGRVDRIAAAQSLRILIVVAIVPPAITALDVHGSDVYTQGATRVRRRRVRDPDGRDARRRLRVPGAARAQRVRAGRARRRDPDDRGGDRPVVDAGAGVEPRPADARRGARLALPARLPARRAPLRRRGRRSRSLLSIALSAAVRRRRSRGRAGSIRRRWCSATRRAASPRCASPRRCSSSACRW